jgi:hypothetical protein
MQKPFVKYCAVFDVNAHQYKLYNNIEKMGFKQNDYSLEATIEHGDPLLISFRSTRSEIFDQTQYLNPFLLAEYDKESDRATKISFTIQSSTYVKMLAAACICILAYNIFTGIVDNAGEIFMSGGFLIALAVADVYMRTSILGRFTQWMNKAAAFNV